MGAYRSSQCSRKMVLQYSHIVSNNPRQWGTLSVTCIITSKSVRGAGLTSAVSCAAADAMSDPADAMAGCMRGASVSRLKIESGDGYVKELVVTVASICSTDEFMMLARAFNSAKASGSALQKRALLVTPRIKSMCNTYPAAGFWVVTDIVDDEKRNALNVVILYHKTRHKFAMM